MAAATRSMAQLNRIAVRDRGAGTACAPPPTSPASGSPGHAAGVARESGAHPGDPRRGPAAAAAALGAGAVVPAQRPEGEPPAVRAPGARRRARARRGRCRRCSSTRRPPGACCCSCRRRTADAVLAELPARARDRRRAPRGRATRSSSSDGCAAGTVLARRPPRPMLTCGVFRSRLPPHTQDHNHLLDRHAKHAPTLGTGGRLTEAPPGRRAATRARSSTWPSRRATRSRCAPSCRRGGGLLAGAPGPRRRCSPTPRSPRSASRSW